MNIHEAKAHLSQLVDRALEGEEIIIARRNRPLVRLVVVPAARGKRQLGTWKGRIWMAHARLTGPPVAE